MQHKTLIKSFKSEKHLRKVWHEAHDKLVYNVKQQDFIPQESCLISSKFKQNKTYLPAFIPYIGPNYFEYKPRVLCYAINQNLSQHAPWTIEWVSKWANDHDLAIDRLNCAVYRDEPMPIRPYAEGFIPLAALIAIQLWIKNQGGNLPSVIEDDVAVTNFIKFSTPDDASSSSIPQYWWKECSQRYVQYEIQTLKPDLIISFGQRTNSELKRILNCAQPTGYAPLLLGCRFPSRIPSIKSRALTNIEKEIWDKEIYPLIKRMRKPTHTNFHKWKIDNYPNYFIDIAMAWEK